jgi:hypothetical protein
MIRQPFPIPKLAPANLHRPHSPSKTYNPARTAAPAPNSAAAPTAPVIIGAIALYMLVVVAAGPAPAEVAPKPGTPAEAEGLGPLVAEGSRTLCEC